VDFSVRMPKASTMSVLLWRKILEFMLKDGGREYMREKLKELKVRLDKVVKYWVEEEYIREI
jgi:uroporphyrinogen-III synthase